VQALACTLSVNLLKNLLITSSGTRAYNPKRTVAQAAKEPDCCSDGKTFGFPRK
jgi:hypothetical protein